MPRLVQRSPVCFTPVCLRPNPACRTYHASKAVVSNRARREQIPPYPYGRATQYKQRDSGLYGNAMIQYGNKVSERNEIKTRRVWRPNIHHKRLWSDALQRFMAVKVQARVLRTIDRVGGLDEYLLGEKTARIKELGVEGWALRWKIMRTEAVKERMGSGREQLGLPKEGMQEQLRLEREKTRARALHAAMEYVGNGKGRPATRAVEIEPTQEQDPEDEDPSAHAARPAQPSREEQRAALLKTIETLAPQAHTSASALLDEARGIQTARQNRREKPPLPRRQTKLVYQPHAEIDAAISAGTARALYDKYRSEQRAEVRRLRKQRQAEVRSMANAILTQMKRGKGPTYRKRSAWDTALKTASKRVSVPEAVGLRPPEQFTRGQWEYLRRASEEDARAGVQRADGGKQGVVIGGAGPNRVRFADWWADVKRNLTARAWLGEDRAAKSLQASR